jgi:hypothetical protein
MDAHPIAMTPRLVEVFPLEHSPARRTISQDHGDIARQCYDGPAAFVIVPAGCLTYFVQTAP